MAASGQTSGDSSSSPLPVVTQTTTPLVSDSGAVPFVPLRFNGNNYLQWSQSMTLFVRGHGREEHLTGSRIAPPTSDSQYRSWSTENIQVMSWLLGSLTPEICKKTLLYSTAKEIWESARKNFCQQELRCL